MDEDDTPPFRDPGFIIIAAVGLAVACASTFAQTIGPPMKTAGKSPHIEKTTRGETLLAARRAPRSETMRPPARNSG